MTKEEQTKLNRLLRIRDIERRIPDLLDSIQYFFKIIVEKNADLAGCYKELEELSKGGPHD